MGGKKYQESQTCLLNDWDKNTKIKMPNNRH